MTPCLTQVNTPKRQEGAVPCVTLLHNEENILTDFLDHYRALGDVSFLVVDDRSTDASREILLSAPDVTVFEPRSGSTYATHQSVWRSELLDRFATGRWVLVPDIDEHFVYVDAETRGLQALVQSLEAEGAEALLTLMIDMYADQPLKDHVYRGGGLRQAFSLFDGPALAPFGYRLLPPPHRFRQRYPTPSVMAYGGFRERLFFSKPESASRLQRWLLDHFAHMGRPLEPGLQDRILNAATRRVTRGLYSSHPFTTTKLGLLKWRRGMSFSGGAHAVSARLRLSNRVAAFLHYPVTRGADGLAYLVERGQHTDGSLFYRRILDAEKQLARSPVFAHSRRYEDSGSLSGLIR